MNIVKRALKAAWDSLKQPNDPLNPAPEVKQKLEEKGYRFTFNMQAYGRAVTTTYGVTAPDGQRVACFGADKTATARYIEDYKQAEAAVRKPAPAND